MAPAYALGALVLASFRDTGWPCRILGAEDGGIVENLPVHHLKGEFEGEEGIAIPTEAFTLHRHAARSRARAACSLLAAAPNSDASTC